MRVADDARRFFFHDGKEMGFSADFVSLHQHYARRERVRICGSAIIGKKIAIRGSYRSVEMIEGAKIQSIDSGIRVPAFPKLSILEASFRANDAARPTLDRPGRSKSRKKSLPR